MEPNSATSDKNVKNILQFNHFIASIHSNGCLSFGLGMGLGLNIFKMHSDNYSAF